MSWRESCLSVSPAKGSLTPRFHSLLVVDDHLAYFTFYLTQSISDPLVPVVLPFYYIFNCAEYTLELRSIVSISVALYRLTGHKWSHFAKVPLCCRQVHMKCQCQILHIHWSQHVTNAEIPPLHVSGVPPPKHGFHEQSKLLQSVPLHSLLNGTIMV